MNYFNKNRLITIVLVALIVVNVVALITIATKSRIFSGDRSPKIERSMKDRDSFRERGERFSRVMSRNLGLSEEQQAKMDELRKANHEEMKPLIERMDTVRKQFNAAMGKREIDEIEVIKLNNEIVTLDGQIRDNLFEYNLGIRSLLNDEQLEKYLEMHRRRTRGGEGRDRGERRRGEHMNMINGIY
ncbi:MAG: periplasmic heavy metal sensor [Saprospiraceae bacterium]|nr:periplasmic heavy metal sensor [Saprospiraceae bacterium]